MRYTVVGIVAASVTEDVEASSGEEAIERATLDASVCHQCSRGLEVGDVYEVRVLDEGGEVVYSETGSSDDAELEHLRAEVERMRAVVEAARRLRAAARATAPWWPHLAGGDLAVALDALDREEASR